MVDSNCVLSHMNEHNVFATSSTYSSTQLNNIDTVSDYNDLPIIIAVTINYCFVCQCLYVRCCNKRPGYAMRSTCCAYMVIYCCIILVPLFARFTGWYCAQLEDVLSSPDDAFVYPVVFQA